MRKGGSTFSALLSLWQSEVGRNTAHASSAAGLCALLQPGLMSKAVLLWIFAVFLYCDERKKPEPETTPESAS